MQPAHSLRYIFAGGKQRWFRKHSKAVLARASGTGPATGQRQGVDGILELLMVGLEVAPELALRLCHICRTDLAEVCAEPRHQAECRGLLGRAGELGSLEALGVGWATAKAMGQHDDMYAMGRALGLCLAKLGHPDAIVMHLEECRRLRVLDGGMLTDAVTIVLLNQRLRDAVSWKAFLQQLPTDQLPALYEVHSLLERAAQSLDLAHNDIQKREAVQLCLEDGRPELLERALAIATGLQDAGPVVLIHDALGRHAAKSEDWSSALSHYLAANNTVAQSECHEQLGDLPQALRLCPAADSARRLRLIEQLERTALRPTGSDDLARSMELLMHLQDILRSEQNPSAVWLERLATLGRHRTELLVAGRQAMQERLDAASSAEARRGAILTSSAFEEAAREWAEAALLLERTGEWDDRLRASQLWERDEQFGEAVRALGSFADRSEAQLRLAQLRESGGDDTGAAAIYEHLGKWRDALRAYESAGRLAQAAHCYLKEHGSMKAAESPEYAGLFVREGRFDELAGFYLTQLEAHPTCTGVLSHLRELFKLHEGQIRSPELRASVATLLAAKAAGRPRKDFEIAIADALRQARQDIDKRYCTVWGMDLGTSKSAVALFDLAQGQAVICPHKGGSTFPSTLAVDKNGSELVGLDGEELMRPDLIGCLERSKRDMGLRKRLSIGARTYSPEEVAARLLAHGRRLAEAFLRAQVLARAQELLRAKLGEEVPPEWLEEPAWAATVTISLPQAVVTIPAYFNFDQRRATKDAAEVAGITLCRLVPEPTAACLSFGLARKLSGKCLVADLGAGTFDLSYMEVHIEKGEGLFEVHQVFGDSQLGSSDFDAAIEKELVERLNQAGVSNLSTLDKRRLRVAAENLKIQLSSSQDAAYEMAGFAGQTRHTATLAASRLGEVLAPHLKRLEAVCEGAKGLPFDHLILVGGPMFSPVIRSRIEEIFQHKAVAVVDPRTAVAMGAACQAAIVRHGDKVPFLLLDIVPSALGLLVKDSASGVLTIDFLVPQGTRIPHRNEKMYTTTDDKQKKIDVRVFQGPGASTEPAANTAIGLFTLEELPLEAAGVPKINVSFDIDINGVLNVTAQDEKSRRTSSIRIADATWLSPDERSAMADKLAAGQAWAARRIGLKEQVSHLQMLEGRLELIAKGRADQEWQCQFDVWERTRKASSFGHIESGDQLVLAEMYNAGANARDQFVLGLDRVRNLAPRIHRFADAAVEASLAEGGAAVGERVSQLEELGRQLVVLAQSTLKELEPLAHGFRRWSATLTHCSTQCADPHDRFLACHNCGDLERATNAYEEAFGGVATAEAPVASLRRYLDCLARLGRGDNYRQVLAGNRDRLELCHVQFDRLQEVTRYVRPSLAWVHVRGLCRGSGFLAGPNLIVTNRHVVSDDAQIVAPHRIVTYVGGIERLVAGIRVPSSPDVDLAILELNEALPSRPLRVGYSELVEVGERVLAAGFPLPEGESFDENFLLDSGIVNRIRPIPNASGRTFQLGLQIAPGMSGGPVINGAGEVVGVSTFVLLKPAGAEQGGYLEKSSHAISVEALRELLPEAW